MEKQFDHLFKLLLTGEANIGKSMLLLKFIDNTFSQLYKPTIGVEFKVKYINLTNVKIKLQIWDTAGQKRFSTFKEAPAPYYRGASGILLVYDITNRESFLKLTNWLSQIHKYADKYVSIILVGMKSDAENDRKVTTQEGMNFAEKHGIKFLQSSAKNGTNVEKAFDILSSVFHQKLNKQKKEEQKVKQIQEIDKSEVKEENLYDILTGNGISDITMQILKSEQIKTMEELNYLKDEDLKQLGIKLGEIARIRKIKTIANLVKS